MLLILSSNLFIEENTDSLNFIILQFFIRKKVFIQFDDENPQVKNWIKEHNKDKWEIALNEYIKEANKTPFKIKSKVDLNLQQSQWEHQCPIITLDDALHLMDMPVGIYVENIRNDRAFLLCIFGKQDRSRIEQLEKDLRLEFKVGGGIGEIKKTIEGLPIPTPYHNKYFVMIDSDPEDIAAPLKKGMIPKEIVQDCQKRRINYHCLARRAIENYFPFEVLINKMGPQHRQNSDSVKKYLAFEGLNKEQKSFYRMKKGLKNDTNASLYQNLSDHDKELLKDGFGREIADNYRQQDLIEDIHRRFRNNDELNNLMHQLKEMMRLPI